MVSPRVGSVIVLGAYEIEKQARKIQVQKILLFLLFRIRFHCFASTPITRVPIPSLLLLFLFPKEPPIFNGVIENTGLDSTQLLPPPGSGNI